MSGPATVVPFGDRAVLVTTPDVAAAHALAARVTDARDAGEAPGAIAEIVVGFASVLAVLGPDPGTADLGTCAAWLADLAATSGRGEVAFPSVIHELPVVFDGADLEDAAALAGVSARRLVDLLVSTTLEVAFIGFAPGFPYLTGLPAELAGLPRRSTPRTSVPAGSVAVAGGFASVYPRATPGGWQLLGWTPVPLFDPVRPPHSLVAPGDRVRFVVADDGVVHAPSSAEERPLLGSPAGRALEVTEPGLLSLVQDGGRHGTAALGVPRAGAADPRAFALVTALLGNPPDAAAIECTATGPSVRVVGDGHLAVVGDGPGAVEVHVDGRPVPDGTVVPVGDGQVVTVGRVRTGLRAYLGVAGGLVTPMVLGSRSSDLLSGLGPGPLRAGDRLARGTPGRVRGRLEPSRRPSGSDGRPDVVHLRVLPGPHARAPGPPDGSGRDDTRFRDLVSRGWLVADDVDRIGVRLRADDASVTPGPAPVPSTPMVTGAVQVPPDGRPIILLPDHATVGGYPVVACVITADLSRVGQLRPGDSVVLVAVDEAVAAAALSSSLLEPAARVAGWFPTAAGT